MPGSKFRLNRALDIGCAVGGSSFRLAETFTKVVGVDLSERFIQAAKDLRKQGELFYDCKVEGEIYSPEKAVISLRAAANYRISPG